MGEEIILFQYQVKTKSQYGTRFYYFYADTDIENYLNNKNIKYVRYAKDTALNKKEKRIKELFKENKHYKHIIDELEKWLGEEIEHYKEHFEFVCKNNSLVPSDDTRIILEKDDLIIQKLEKTLNKLQELKGA